MASRSLRFVPLLLLLVACDKKVINEVVKPRTAAVPTPTPMRDCTVVVCDDGGAEDAGVSDGGLSEYVESGAREFTKSNLLAAIGDCALAAYRVFEERAVQLESAVSAFGDDPSDANWKSSREAYRAAMSSLQWAEVFRFGPLAGPAEPGGKDLRAELYSYPTIVTCSVDQALVSQSYANASFASAPATQRGFDALEYLLFYQGSENACAASSAINVNGSWAKLDAGELKRRRAAYAAQVARQIAVHAHELVKAFSPDGDDFQRQFTSAGRGSKVYASEQAALNAVSNALFYVDLELKDSKLALPLGLSMNCAASSCPQDVESPFARLSSSNIARNLGAFRAIFQGCAEDHSGLGFDDWLASVDQKRLADSMLAALDSTEAKVAGLGAPLEDVIMKDLTKARGVYDALKQLTDLMKTNFVTVLDLGTPPVVGTDND